MLADGTRSSLSGPLAEMFTWMLKNRRDIESLAFGKLIVSIGTAGVNDLGGGGNRTGQAGRRTYVWRIEREYPREGIQKIGRPPRNGDRVESLG